MFSIPFLIGFWESQDNLTIFPEYSVRDDWGVWCMGGAL